MALLSQLIGDSPGIAAVRDQIGRLLGRHSELRRLPPILILGETGTGKGLVARAIHRAGPRASGPLVDVNCAAIPETMLEAEMFGYERGAFTDARQSKPGLFQTAHRGTLFLDEVGLLPSALQAKLLKALEDRAVRRLGSTRSEPADVWILSATSVDLEAAIREHQFREDLYHRLAVITVSLPPLRERGQDILLLARHFLAQVCGDYGLPSKNLAPDASAALLGYRWPGNVRELANVLERVVLLSEGTSVTADALGFSTSHAAKPVDAAGAPASALLEDAVAHVEREHLLSALGSTRWNITRAAADLGISRDTLRYRIAKYGLRPPDTAPARRPTPRPSSSASMLSDRALVRADPEPGIRWEERRIALLKVSLRGVPAANPSSRADRELQMVVDKIQGFGGLVQELNPTEVIAAFGLEAVEDAPRRAALAALAIRRAAERARQVGADVMAPRMAIHVGPFLVGEAGGAFELETEVKRAAWGALEAMVAGAEPEAILTAENAYSSLERRFELEPVVGLEAAPAQVYRLVGHERSGLETGRRMAAFVGRDPDVDLLRSALQSAVSGQGRTIGIVGEAGMGKSRLLFEFRQQFEVGLVSCLEGHCLSYASATPYLPLIELVRQTFGIADGDPPETIVERIAGALDGLGLDGATAAPYLLHLIGVQHRTSTLATLSPEAVKTRIFEALRQVYLRMARLKPLVLIVEDVHWIDRTSEEWLSSLAESLPRVPMLLLVSYRPGYRPPWIERSYASQMALRPLGRDESMSVVKSVAATPLPEVLARSIVDRASGNPFFLEELCRSSLEQGPLLPPVAVPDTIQDVLRARIIRLPDAPRRLLQTAAVLGRSLSLRLLKAVWEGPEPLEPHLRELARLELLYDEGAGEEADCVFNHALVQEVAYENLPTARRQALHAAAGKALETMYAGRLDEVADRLAHHWSRAAVANKAVTYLARLADKAASSFAHVEAVAAVQEALAHVEHLGPDERDRQLIALILRQVESLTSLGRFENIIAILLRHREQLEHLDDPALSGRYFFWLARTYGILGDPVRTVEYARRTLAEATRCGDQTTMGNAHFALAYECFWSGRPSEGIERASEAVRLLEQTEEQRWLGHACWVLGINHAMLGEIAPALAAHTRARAIGEAIADPRLQTLAILSVGADHALAGEWDPAIAACRQGLDLGADPVEQALGLGFLGAVYVEMGEPAQAIPLLEEAVRRYSIFRVRQTEGWFTALLGEAYLQQGDAERAMTLAAAGLEIVAEIGYRWGAGTAQRILGRVALARDFLPDAAHRLGEALQTFTAIGTQYEVARTHLDLARLTHRRADLDATRTHLRSALQLFDALRIPHYVDYTRRLSEDLGATLLDS